MSDIQNRNEELSNAEVTRQLQILGVKKGGVLLVHTSFHATKPVEGGPAGLIEAIHDALGPKGTLVMPSWSEDYEVPFNPLTTPASPDLGIVADVFWRLPRVHRSDHCFAFAAAGPEALHIVSDELPLPPHIPESPVGRVYELDGQVLFLGVGHEADTTLHLAEIIAEVPYHVPRHCTVLRDGKPVRVEYEENDHCCECFGLADEWLRGQSLQSEGCVGHAYARLVHSRNIVEVALEHLAKDPLLFLHPTSVGCEDCDEARKSVKSGRD